MDGFSQQGIGNLVERREEERENGCKFLLKNKLLKPFISGSQDLNTRCKEQLPAPGNRSNERRYRKKDLATTEEKKVGTGEKREGDEKSRGREK
ncbi:hypothetical protein TNCV_2649841 [Trichonephila clavipes]|nr:hypothetical protein TNCV_2649841 [Trichonephila clavipes]